MGVYPDHHQRAWAATIARADAFIFIAPEYNHGYSAALKNAFDWVYAEWAGKAATFVSFGNANGTRAVQQIKQVMGELRMVPVEPALALRPHGHIDKRRFVGTDDDERRLSGSLGELLRWEKALRSLRAPRPNTSWTGRRVLVVGLDLQTNRSVVAPLAAAGVDAHGMVISVGDKVPDGDGYDLVAIGRGAAGETADAIRAAVYLADASKPVVDVVGPLAVRQILSACDPHSPRLAVQSIELAGLRLSVRVGGDDGRIGVTAFELACGGLVPNRLAEFNLRGGEATITVDLPAKPYSVVIDLDGAAFYHLPVL
jgi:NAD(P)H-dependent FMN reductase